MCTSSAMCCSVLQCVAVCCSVLQCVAVCWSVLQCVTACYSVLQCVAMCWSVLQCVGVYCRVLECCCFFITRHVKCAHVNIVCRDTVCQRDAVSYSVLQCAAVSLFLHSLARDV